MTFVRLGRRKGRLGIRARSAIGWGGPPFVPGSLTLSFGKGQMSWRAARVVSATLLWGEAAEMTVRAAAVHPGEAYWGDASEMEATGGVVP